MDTSKSRRITQIRSNYPLGIAVCELENRHRNCSKSLKYIGRGFIAMSNYQRVTLVGGFRHFLSPWEARRTSTVWMGCSTTNTFLFGCIKQGNHDQPCIFQHTWVFFEKLKSVAPTPDVSGVSADFGIHLADFLRCIFFFASPSD